MNPLLQQSEQQTLAKANPQLVPAIQHVVDSGKKLMFGADTRQKFFAVLQQQDPTKIGQSFAGIAVILFAQSGSKMPMQVLIPASTILLCEGLQFFEDSGKQQVNADYLAAAEKAMGEMILRLFKADPSKISQAAMAAKQAGQQGGQAPAAPATTDAAPAPAMPSTGIVGGAMQGGA
jgi:hypothetical protein